MKHMTMSFCDISLKLGSWSWTGQALISSWPGSEFGHYPSEKNPPSSCTTAVSATIMPHLYCGDWKLKLQVTFFQMPPQNMSNIFKQRHATLRFFLILEEETPIEKGVLKCHQIKLGCILPIWENYVLGTSRGGPQRDKDLCIWS